MRFYTSVKPLTVGQSPPTLIIEAPTAQDAKSWAQRVIGNEELIVKQIEENDGVPDWALRWVGDDYNFGGTPKGLRMEVRQRGANGKLGDWRAP